jgi:hypothetical protein
MRHLAKIAPCLLLQLGLALGGVGCVAGSAADVAEQGDEPTADATQAWVGAPPLGPGDPLLSGYGGVDLYAICPVVVPGNPLWPICEELYSGYGGYGGYGIGGIGGIGGHGGFGGHGYGGGHFGGGPSGGDHGYGGGHVGGGPSGGGPSGGGPGYGGGGHVEGGGGGHAGGGGHHH